MRKLLAPLLLVAAFGSANAVANESIVVPKDLDSWAAFCVPYAGESDCPYTVEVLDDATGAHRVLVVATRSGEGQDAKHTPSDMVAYPNLGPAFEAVATCSVGGEEDPRVVALAQLADDQEVSVRVARAWRISDSGHLVAVDASQTVCFNEYYGLDMD